MELKDFTTLAEAQAYKSKAYKKISCGQAMQYFGLTGILDSLESRQGDVTSIILSPEMETTVGALCRTVLNSAKTTGFACDPETEDGANNRGAAQLLLNAGVFPDQAHVDNFWLKGTVETQPYKNATQAEFDEAKDAGEIITLPANNNHHTATISITTHPLKPVDIVIEQRFSKDGTDWTEWHQVGAFRGVYYTQRSYEAGIVASPAQYRELRAISPLTLGVEVA